MNERHSGPIVWLGIIAGTCILLFLLRQVLWLVVPFLLGVILYYMLMPIMLRLLLTGFSRNLAAAIVAGGFLFAFGLIALLCSPWILAHAGSWQDLIGRYLDGGTSFILNTARMLEQKFTVLHNFDMNDGDSPFAPPI